MSKTKKSHRRGKKRNYKKKGKMNKVVSLKLNSLYLPDTIRVPLKYVYIGNTLNTISDDFNLNAWKLNSMYDSGLTLSTNNALGTSTYGSIYQNFFVYASAIKVQIVNMDIDVPLRITLLPTTLEASTTITSTTDTNLLGNPYAKSAILGNATGNDSKLLKHYISLRKLTGQAKLDSSNDDYVGYTSSHAGGQVDPPEDLMWVLAVQALSNVSDNIDLLVSVEITYYTQFFNRLTVQ